MGMIIMVAKSANMTDIFDFVGQRCWRWNSDLQILQSLYKTQRRGQLSRSQRIEQFAQ